MDIRLEKPEEYRQVENLVREAFWNVYRPGCLEHYVVHVLRNDPAFVPQMDLVMEQEGELIGHVMYMRAAITADDGREIPMMTFGPISIAPAPAAARAGQISAGLFHGEGQRIGRWSAVHRRKSGFLRPIGLCLGRNPWNPLPR